MAIICPTVTASTETEYATQIARIAPLTDRLHIDLMDDDFASPASVTLDQAWWPAHKVADIHLMYRSPMDYLDKLKHLKPSLVIVHVETMFHHMHFAAELHKAGIDAGLSIMPDTPIANIEQILHSFDHLLIFSGHLGHFGGMADLGLLEKVRQAKAIHPDVEIGWDGGINADNARALVEGGIDVLNTGGYIQKSDDPAAAYQSLVTIAA
jgi:ribulose-phosphate 3-epimerase